MSWVGDTFFGGAEKKAAKQQAEAYKEGQDIIQENVQQARSDIMSLFPSAQQNMLTGVQGALDVFNQTTPMQGQLFQQGNVGAQNVLAGMLPQQASAILGGAIDYSAMQPQQFQLPQFNYQMPEFQTSQQALQPEQPEPQNVGTLLGGGYGGYMGGRFNPYMRQY